MASLRFLSLPLLVLAALSAAHVSALQLRHQQCAPGTACGAPTARIIELKGPTITPVYGSTMTILPKHQISPLGSSSSTDESDAELREKAEKAAAHRKRMAELLAKRREQLVQVRALVEAAKATFEQSQQRSAAMEIVAAEAEKIVADAKTAIHDQLAFLNNETNFRANQLAFLDKRYASRISELNAVARQLIKIKDIILTHHPNAAPLLMTEHEREQQLRQDASDAALPVTIAALEEQIRALQTALARQEMIHKQFKEFDKLKRMNVTRSREHPDIVNVLARGRLEYVHAVRPGTAAATLEEPRVKPIPMLLNNGVAESLI